MTDGPVFEAVERDTTKCGKPSYYRYQRGCRCNGCAEAYKAKRLEFRHRQAEREGRVHGERPCDDCGAPISTLGGSTRKRYCDTCGVERLKAQQAHYRQRKSWPGRQRPARANESSPATIEELPTELLTIGDDVRLDEDDEALEDLASSIEEFGVLQPLVVRTLGDGWEVVAGRRRLAAARIAGIESLPCVVRELDDDRAFDVTLAENLHRRDLSWIEVALGYKRLRDRGMQQQEIAALVGKHDSQVSQVLKLLDLPEELQHRVHCRELSYGDALRLHRYGDPKGSPKGSSTTRGEGGSSADAAAAEQWRRRHERLLAGIGQMLKAREADEAELRRMLDRLLKLDRQPLSANKSLDEPA